MLQVRNLPDDVHAKLKQRAVAARMSLSDYVANQLTELVSYRTNAEVLDELQSLIRDAPIPRDQVLAAQQGARDERESQ